MHIKDHSAAMKFFRTYDNVASKGKWKEFVDEMEFDSMLQEPRTMVHEPRNMAHGGRIGFYKGESVVKSHGKQVKDLTEAGESSVSIAKFLKLKQQSVNNAMDAMDTGLAGDEFKLSKPRKDIIKLSRNQWTIRSDEAIQKILEDPKYEGWSKKSFTNEKILTRDEITRLEDLGFDFTPGKPGKPKKKLENVFELLHDAEIKAFKAGDLSEDRIRQLYRSRRNQTSLRMPFPKNANDALYNDFYLGSQNKNSRYKIVKGTSFGNKRYPNTTDLRKVKFKDNLTGKILSYDGIEKFDFKQTVMKDGKMTLGKSMPYDDVISAYEFKINLNQHPEIKTKINQSYVKGWDEMPNHIKARSGQAYSVQHNLAKHLDPANTSFSFFDQNKKEFNIKKDFLDKFNKKLPYSKKKKLYQTYKTSLATEAPDVVSTFGTHTTGTPMKPETFIEKSGVKKTKDIKSFSEKIRPKGSGVQLSSFPANLAESKTLKKVISGGRKIGLGYELGFIGLDFMNNLDNGMDTDTAFQTALSNATFGMYEGGKQAQWEDFETAGKELGHNPENLSEIKSIMDLEKMLTGEKEVLNEMIAYNAQEGTGEGLQGEFPAEEIEWRKDVVSRLEKEFENKQNTFWSKDNAQDLVKNYQDTVGYVARKEYNANLETGLLDKGRKDRVNPEMGSIGSALWETVADWKDYVPQSLLPQNFLQNEITKAIPNTLRKLPGVLGDMWEPTSEAAKFFDMSEEEKAQRAKDLNIQEQYYHPVTGNTMTYGQMEPYYEKFYSGGGIASLNVKK